MFALLKRKKRDISLRRDPIFILGVPRSGTTLLRILLDSHPNIACGPESPWLARTDISIKNLYQFMAHNQFGFVENFGVNIEQLRQETADYINRLYLAYAANRGKSRWAEKTPDHCLEIPFLAEIFPDAYFIHIVRDGRDVACSTSTLSEERRSISDWHTNNLLMDDGVIVVNSLLNAGLRWQVWINKIEAGIKHVRRSCTLRYEDLVASPETEMRRLMEFVGESFSISMLDYSKVKHEFPKWEWGSRDVERSSRISPRSICRWRKQLDQETILDIESQISATLIKYGYDLSEIMT